MKYIFYILLFFPVLAFAQNKISLKDAIAKCNGMNSDAKKKSTLCKKVNEKLKKKQKSLLNIKNKENLTKEKIKNKCESLGNEGMMKYSGCRQYLFKEPDPLLSNSSNVSSQYQFNLGYGFFGNTTGLELEALKRLSHFSIGAFYNQQNIEDVRGNEIDGNVFGLSLKYHFIPLSYSVNHLDIAVFTHIGSASYESNKGQKLPSSYMYLNVGMEARYALNKNVAIYGKLGSVNIYHQDSNFVNLGAMGTMGLSFGF